MDEIVKPNVIALLESATEGSRELDVKIANAIGLLWDSDDGEFWVDIEGVRGDTVPLPKFSTSLDAAMDLVPDACVVGLQWRFGGTVRAELYRSGEGNIGYAIGNSGPLAICLVSLSARASQSKAA